MNKEKEQFKKEILFKDKLEKHLHKLDMRDISYRMPMVDSSDRLKHDFDDIKKIVLLLARRELEEE